MKRLALSIASALICAGVVQAAPTVALRLEVTPKKATIGDVIQCELTSSYSSGVAMVPSTAPWNIGIFEERDPLTVKTRPLAENKTQTVMAFTFVSFSTGVQTLPPLPVTFATQDGGVSQVQTEPVSIEIRSLLQEKGDEGGLRPMQGFYSVPSYLWLWIGIGALVLALTAWFVTRWIRKRRAGAGGLESGPAKPPEEIAYEALHALEFSDWIEKGLIKEYYSQLSFITRRYLEHRFEISALELTTSELWMEIRGLQLPSEPSALLRGLLETADLVKFAKLRPDIEEIERDLNNVKKIIALTTPERKAEAEAIPV